MISSESNSQIKEIIKLQKNSRERKKRRVFISEGIKLTEEASDLGMLCKVYFSESYYEKNASCVENNFSCPMEIVADGIFKEISETVTPQGVLGIVKMPQYDLDEILGDDRRSFVLLEDLRDPGNLGTIMRTAEGAGMSGVILTKESVDLFNPKTVRSTMGAIFRVPFCYVEDIVSVIEKIKSNGIDVYGTMMEGSEIYYDCDYKSGAAIVIGNEANGISENVIDSISKAIRIPMQGRLESLNASVAAAVLMYEIARQKS